MKPGIELIACPVLQGDAPEAAKDGLITITTKEWIDHKAVEQKREEAAVTEGF